LEPFGKFYHTLEEAKIPKILRYVRFKDGWEYWVADRGGTHYILTADLQNLTYGSQAKGKKGPIAEHFDLMVNNRIKGIGEYDLPTQIDTEKLDDTGKKHFDIFLKPVFGSVLDWDKNVDVIGDSQTAEQEQFHKVLLKQLREWKGGRSNLNITKHRYWPKFQQLVIEAVKKEFGDKIKLYRGIWGDQA
jgi:hypothetical protein